MLLIPEGTKNEVPSSGASAGGMAGAQRGWLSPEAPGGWLQGTASAEVTVRQEEGGYQGPQVEKQPRPAGTDLHPHGGPGADHLLGLTGSGTQQHPSEPGPQSCDLIPGPDLIIQL